jgi:hypothetical protein
MAKEKFKVEVCTLDEAQARVAQSLKRGHQMIKGPPGCGKTLVLVNRCCLLRRFSAPEKKILLVGYNTSFPICHINSVYQLLPYDNNPSIFLSYRKNSSLAGLFRRERTKFVAPVFSCSGLLMLIY